MLFKLTAKELTACLHGRFADEKGVAKCPCHDDRRASLSIAPGRNGDVVFKCHAGCAQETLLEEFGRRGFLNDEPGATTRRIEDISDYADEGGTLLFQVVRFCPKDFRPRRPDGAGGWTWRLDDTRRVLYRLPNVLTAIAEGRRIYVCEGEKGVRALVGIGLDATCSSGGTGGVAQWTGEHKLAESLRGADVALLPDNDRSGREHMRAIATALQDVAAAVRMVELPNLPKKADCFDWVAAGGTKEALEALVEATPAGEMPELQESKPEPAKFIRAADLLGMEFPPPVYTIPGILVEGATLVVGPPKIGKSWMMLDWCVAVATGGKALGGIECEQGDALYLALEDPARRLQSRLLTVLQGEIPDTLDLTFATAAPRMGPELFALLDEWREASENPRIVVVDVLQMVRADKKGERIYTQDYDTIKKFTDWANRHHIAVIIIHHTRKATADDPQDMVSGTQGLMGAADAGLVILKVPKGRKGELMLSGQGRDIEPFAVGLLHNGGSWELLQQSEAMKGASDLRQAILEAIAGEPKTPAEIAKETGRKAPSVRCDLRRMVKMGLIYEAAGRYLRAGMPVATPATPATAPQNVMENQYVDHVASVATPLATPTQQPATGQIPASERWRDFNDAAWPLH